MLRKFVRRKVRNSFAVDKLYSGLLLDKATKEEKQVLQRAKVCTKWFDDDLFCHMLIQQDRMIMNKIKYHKKDRLFLFYPNYIPLIDSKQIVSKSEYHWTYNTINYPCVRCNKETICYYEDFSLRNLLCGECISNHYMMSNDVFRQSKEDKLNYKTYLENSSKFYEFNKERQKKIFSKLIKRQKSFYTKDMTLPKRQYLIKLTKIEDSFNKLVE